MSAEWGSRPRVRGYQFPPPDTRAARRSWMRLVDACAALSNSRKTQARMLAVLMLADGTLRCPRQQVAAHLRISERAVTKLWDVLIDARLLWRVSKGHRGGPAWFVATAPAVFDLPGGYGGRESGYPDGAESGYQSGRLRFPLSEAEAGTEAGTPGTHFDGPDQGERGEPRVRARANYAINPLGTHPVDRYGEAAGPRESAAHNGGRVLEVSTEAEQDPKSSARDLAKRIAADAKRARDAVRQAEPSSAQRPIWPARVEPACAEPFDPEQTQQIRIVHPPLQAEGRAG